MELYVKEIIMFLNDSSVIRYNNNMVFCENYITINRLLLLLILCTFINSNTTRAILSTMSNNSNIVNRHFYMIACER